MTRYIAAIAAAGVLIFDVPEKSFNPAGITFWMILILVLVMAFVASFGGKAIEEHIKNNRKCRGNGKKTLLKD